MVVVSTVCGVMAIVKASMSGGEAILRLLRSGLAAVTDSGETTGAADMRGATPAAAHGAGDGASSGPALSIVSPVYMGAESVGPLVEAIAQAVESITTDYEIVLVEDRSPDASWEAVVAVADADPRIKAIRLSRNFGQHNAILAGLEHARGERVAILDCDLQDDPRYLPQMYAAMTGDIDVVLTRKARRRHNAVRNVVGSLYARLMRVVAGAGTEEHSDQIGNYMLLSRKAVDGLLSIGDAHPHLLVSLAYIGFERTVIDIEHRERPHGESSYSLGRLIRFAVADTALQSKRLLYFSVGLGIGFVMVALLAIVVLVALWATKGFLEGWTSMMCLMLLSTGSILFCLGVIGLYLGAVVDETRSRPAYLISDSRNLEPPAQDPSSAIRRPRS